MLTVKPRNGRSSSGSRGRTLMLVLSVFLIVLVACSPAATATEAPAPTEAPAATEAPAELVPVTIRLSWLVKGDFVPLFVAKAKGYFADEGIDAQILEGGTGIKPNQNIASGVDDFGYLPVPFVVQSVESGMGLKMVGVFLQIDPVAVVTMADVKNDGPQDLIGKNIGETAGGSLALVWDALLKLNNIPADKVNLVIVDGGAKQTLFLSKQVDGISMYATNELPALQVTQGLDMNYWLLADNGFQMLSQGLATSETYLDAHPDIVRGVVRAVQRGFAYTRDHQDEAAQIMADDFPDVLKKDILVKQVAELMTFTHTANTQDQPLGWTSPDDMESTVSILYDNGALDTRQDDANYYFTNDYVDMGIH